MYDPEQITFFAKTDARGQQVPFGVKAGDRTKHVYVIGKTGMGKSTLLENMAVQDIKNGNGLAFIDPHGQTAETLLDYIPEERMDDVLYFAPFDTDNPISFNVMEDVGPDKRHLVVSGLMSVFKKIWVDAWSARMEYILSNTLLALLEYPDATLLGVNRMLSEKDYRKRVIDNITDPAVKSFWVDEFLKYNERYMQEAGDAIKNKIGQFTSNPLIRNIIGQPHSSFDIREIMDQRKIMIINLSKGLVGEQNANLLGSMLTTRIYLAAMSRADMTAPQMKEAPNFYFYVDEFQSFANATFADILSEARKYKLNLTIAHQYIEQMEEEVRNAVFGNVGTIISFRVGPFDAEVLETVYTPKFLAPDIVNLGFAQIYLTLMIDGIGSQPFSAVTLPPIETTGPSFKEMVIARSRAKFSFKRGGVEETIHAWHAKSFSDKPPYIPKHLREGADAVDVNTPVKSTDGKPPVRTTGPPRTTGPARTTGSSGGQKKSRTTAPSAPKKDTERNAVAYTKAKHEAHTTKSAPAKSSAESEGRPPASKPRAESTATSTTQEPRSERTRTQPPQRTTGRPVKDEKSLDDLRSVLKNLSGDTPKQDDKKSSEKSPEKKDNKIEAKDSESSLKDALAAAMKDVTKKDTNSASEIAPIETKKMPQQKTENKQVEKKDRYAAEIHKITETNKKTSSKFLSVATSKIKEDKHTHKHKEGKVVVPNLEKSSEPVAKPATDEVTAYAEMKNIDDPLSPKKLERMMRVTTQDKPPLK